MAVNWDQVNKILSSKGTEMGLQMLGAALQSKQQADQFDRQIQLSEQDNARNAAQFRANLLQRQEEADRANQLARAGGVLNASPLGANENFATRNRIARALLPRMANAPGFTPADPAIAAMMPSGGLNLQGLFTPEMLQGLDENATAAAIGRREKMLTNVDPSMPMADLGAMGLDRDGSQQALMDEWQSEVQQEEAAKSAQTRELIMRALDEDLMGPGEAPEGMEYDKETGQLKKKGSSIWKKIGKGAIIGGGLLATALTGGAASPALMAAIGAGTGAGVGAIDGGWKGALMGAGMGAATAGIGGGGAGATAGQIGKQAAVSMLKDPRFWMQTVGGAAGGKVGTALSLGSQFMPQNAATAVRQVPVANRFGNRAKTFGKVNF
jgi:hypothetical protein